MLLQQWLSLNWCGWKFLSPSSWDQDKTQLKNFHCTAVCSDAFWPQGCDNALRAPAGHAKQRGPDTCGVETFLLLMSAKHNYSVLHFSCRRFKHLGLEALRSCVRLGFPWKPPPCLPEPTPTHFMKSDGDPLWPSREPAGVKPIRWGYKMLLLFFLSVIKAVNYLLMEAAAVAAATGGPTTCRCRPWRDVNTFQVSCQECFRSMCATELLWVVTRYQNWTLMKMFVGLMHLRQSGLLVGSIGLLSFGGNLVVKLVCTFQILC